MADIHPHPNAASHDRNGLSPEQLSNWIEAVVSAFEGQQRLNDFYMQEIDSLKQRIDELEKPKEPKEKRRWW